MGIYNKANIKNHTQKVFKNLKYNTIPNPNF